MKRSTQSIERPKTIEQTQNRLDVSTANNTAISDFVSIERGGNTYSTSTSQIRTSRPNLRNIAKKDKTIIYPSIRFFEYMPGDVVKKILFKYVINLNNIPSTAIKLMTFASVSKFNREFVRDLLTEEGLHEISFFITKSAIPNLLATLANDKKAKFSQYDINDFVHNWPYLTFDSSCEKNRKFSENGVQALKNIVSHPRLQEIRIINTVMDRFMYYTDIFQAPNNNGPELLYSLLSRESSSSLKVDFNFKNWLPPLNANFEFNKKSLDTINEIQSIAQRCHNVSFGKLNLSRQPKSKGFCDLGSTIEHNREYQLQFLKMMCNIGLLHFAQSISLVGLYLYDEELVLILNEIQKYDKQSLLHLDLSANYVGEFAAKKLSAWLQTENISLKTLKLNSMNLCDNHLSILEQALKNNSSLELIEIKLNDVLSNHPITNDKRVILTE